MCGISWSSDWNKNTALADEAVALLGLVEAVEFKMRGHDEGKITIQEECGKVW